LSGDGWAELCPVGQTWGWAKLGLVEFGIGLGWVRLSSEKMVRLGYIALRSPNMVRWGEVRLD
jgi:hypothetical protein